MRHDIVLKECMPECPMPTKQVTQGVNWVCRLGKVAVTAACGLIAFGLSDLKYYTDPVNHPDSYLSSPLMPVLISVLTGYTISNLFLQVRLGMPVVI